jgi:hypothetical protein
MHSADTKISQAKDFHNQAERLSDYYQIEVTYSCTEDFIVLMAHVPCIKDKSLLTIYRYSLFPIRIPYKLTISPITISQFSGLLAVAVEVQLWGFV